MTYEVECKECGLPVSPYNGEAKQVDPDVCEFCMITMGVPEDFTPKDDFKAELIVEEIEEDDENAGEVTTQINIETAGESLPSLTV